MKKIKKVDFAHEAGDITEQIMASAGVPIPEKVAVQIVEKRERLFPLRQYVIPGKPGKFYDRADVLDAAVRAGIWFK